MIRSQVISTKILFSLLFMVLGLLCMGSASAASGDFILLDTSSSDVIYVNGSSGNDNWDGQSWNTAKLSIKNATGTINNNGTIHIADWTYTGQNNTNITINKNMTIIGQSQTGTIINGTNTGRIFTVNNGISLILENLTMCNGNATNGAAIYTAGDLTINNCTVSKNSFSSAIYSQGNLNISNSTFKENSAAYGGAIYNYSNYGNCTITGSTFSNNTVTANGGAIYTQTYGFLNITNSTFANNTASNGGGAIINWLSTVNLISNTFINNKVSSYGTIYNVATLNAHFNRFYDDQNCYSYSEICTWGSSAVVNLTNNWYASNFNPRWNKVSNDTAIPWILANFTVSSNSLAPGENATISVCLKYNSNGEDTSGLGAVPDVPVTFSATSGNIISSAVISGGLVTNVIFTADSKPGFAIINATVDGQAFSTIIIVNSQTKSDVYVATDGSDTSGDGSQNNPYKSLAKAIDEVKTNGTVHVAGGTYSGPNNRGLTIYKNTTIILDTWRGTGTALIDADHMANIFNVFSGISFILQNFTLQNGNATLGGAIANNEYCTMIISNCKIQNNSAYYGGGMINYWNSNCTLINCTISNNNATCGGGISNSGNCTAINSTLNNNSAREGGGIYNENEFTAENCTISNNNATDGGGILNDWGYCSVNCCTISNNNATNGGGICNDIGYCTVNCCTISNNNAINGGGIYNFEYLQFHWGNCTVHFSRFFNNTATNGTAICSNSEYLNATNNWWASNIDPKSRNNLIAGDIANVNASDWVILSVNATPNCINNTQNSTVTADFNHINGGRDLVGGHIPDGPITLDIPWGSFISSRIEHSFTADTIAGVMIAIFYANEGAINPLFNPVRVNATADGYTTNDTESAYIALNPAAHVVVTKIVNNTAPNYLDLVTFTITAHNNGPDGVTGLQVTDLLLDSGLNFVSSSSPNYNSTTGIWDIGTLLNGNEAVLSIVANVTGTGTIVNWANVTAQTTFDASTWSKDSATLIVLGAAYVQIFKEFRDAPWGNVITTAFYNDRIYALVHVSNDGPDSTSISVLDSFAGFNWTGTYYVLRYIIPNIPSNWEVNDSVNMFNGTHWNIPALGSGLGGNSMWLAIEGIINQIGTVSNHAETVNQNKYPYRGYDAYTAYLTANSSTTSIIMGNVTGNRDKTVILNAILKDYLNNPLSGKTVEFYVDNVKVGENSTNNGIATFNYNITQISGTYNTTAKFLGDYGYLASTGNGTLKVSQSSVYVNVTASKTNPTVGETITLTFKLGNNGPDPADDVVFTYVIPEGMDFVSIETEPGYPQATYNPANRTITWPLGTVPILDPWLRINVRVLGSGYFNVHPTVTTITYDPTLGNDIQQITINAIQAANAASSTSKTIGMQETGIPVIYLILAILALFGGLVLPKRK